MNDLDGAAKLVTEEFPEVMVVIEPGDSVYVELADGEVLVSSEMQIRLRPLNAYRAGTCPFCEVLSPIGYVAYQRHTGEFPCLGGKMHRATVMTDLAFGGAESEDAASSFVIAAAVTQPLEETEGRTYYVDKLFICGHRK